MRRPRSLRPQRVPVFIGGEGRSEIAYAGWLRNLARDRDIPVHLELCDLGQGAGDPYTRIEMAIERVERIVKLGVFVNSAPGFTDQPRVANGASDLMVALFGDAGKHARAAVGVAALPLGAAVEVDAIVKLAD